LNHWFVIDKALPPFRVRLRTIAALNLGFVVRVPSRVHVQIIYIADICTLEELQISSYPKETEVFIGRIEGIMTA
jgi:hypothetical protein